ncbi:MAG TPA: hypothetical protein VIH27_06775 [Nitrososphaerales archaeon]
MTKYAEMNKIAARGSSKRKPVSSHFSKAIKDISINIHRGINNS